ncbi:hypothetical protein JCM3775_004557, partial [Rhodotorula graminis]
MLAGLLKLLLISLNIRSSFKALRPAQRKARGSARGVPAREGRTERSRRRAVRDEVANWVVLVCVLLVEKAADKTVAWVVPLYGTLKCFVFATVVCWRGPGSLFVYDKVLRPLVRPYERPLDAVGFVAGEVLDILVAAVLFMPRWAAGKLRARRAEPDVPAILRGLRNLHQPRLAQSLADSIERSRGDTDAISARLSRPVEAPAPAAGTGAARVRVQQVPYRPARAPAPAPTQEQRGAARDKVDEGPRPAVASTAPFRPVIVVPPSTSTAPSTATRPAGLARPLGRTRTPAARPSSSLAAPVAHAPAPAPATAPAPSNSTGPSRLPVPRTSAAARPPVEAAAASSRPAAAGTSASASLYPSLAGLTAPLAPPTPYVPSAPTPAPAPVPAAAYPLGGSP